MVMIAIRPSALCLAAAPLQNSGKIGAAIVVIGAVLAAIAALVAFVPVFRGWARSALVTIWQARVSVTIGVILAAVAYQLWRDRWAGPSTDRAHPSAARRVSGSWPMDRGNLARTGSAPHATGPVQPVIRWRHGRPGESFYASAAVTDDYLFIVGNRDERARVYCLDRRTGEWIWSGGPVDYAPTFSSPVVFGGRLFCGEGLHETRRGRLVTLGLNPSSPGALLGEIVTQGHVECTPQATDEGVFFNAGDDGIYAARFDSATTDVPTVAFHLPGSKYPDAETALAVYRGRLYVGLGVGGAALCLLDATSGKELRRVAMPYPVFTPPSFADDSVLIGMGEGDYATPDRQPVGAVYALDHDSLETRWKRELPGAVLGAIALDGGEAFFGCADGRVYGIRLQDRAERTWDSGAPIAAALAVTKETVFGINARGRLFAIDRATFAPRWSLQLGGRGRYVSAPVVADDLLYVGTENDGFFCIGSR